MELVNDELLCFQVIVVWQWSECPVCSATSASHSLFDMHWATETLFLATGVSKETGICVAFLQGTLETAKIRCSGGRLVVACGVIRSMPRCEAPCISASPHQQLECFYSLTKTSVPCSSVVQRNHLDIPCAFLKGMLEYGRERGLRRGENFLLFVISACSFNCVTLYFISYSVMCVEIYATNSSVLFTVELYPEQ